MAESHRKTELWVGVFVFIGLALLGGLIVQFGRFGDRMRGKYQFVVVFDDASGLIKGSEIRMGGARIGKVAEHPELNANVKVQVTMSVDDAIRIPENSMIQIASATLLGNTAALAFDDTTAVPGTTYHYWIVSKNSAI
jgi:phospholipid/cholesterol/gamma-HCH transport system substrate-binding protein